MNTRIAKELNLPADKVLAVLDLLDGDATIPFIARYRKEATGGMDETVIAAVRDRREELTKLRDRREAIVKSLAERGLLTPELEKAVADADSLARLEDLLGHNTAGLLQQRDGTSRQPLCRFHRRQSIAGWSPRPEPTYLHSSASSWLTSP